MSSNCRLVWSGQACVACGESSPNLQLCGRCKYVRYCNKKCQLKHFPMHKQFCSCIGSVGRPDMFCIDPTLSQDENIQSLQKWLNRFVFPILGRQLSVEERNIITWQPHCAVCFKRAHELPGGKMFKTCANCKSYFACSNQHWTEFVMGHCAETCHSLKTSHECDKLLELEGPVFDLCRGEPPSSSLTSPLQEWREWIEWRGLEGIPESVIFASSHNYSFSLTLAWGMNAAFKSKVQGHVIVHLIGADANECYVSTCFEEVLHVNEDISLLELVMIGPDVPVSLHGTTMDFDVCSSCESGRRQLKQRFFSLSYEEFLGMYGIDDPTFRVTFNCGIHEFPSSWSELLRNNRMKCTPWLLTSYNEKESLSDLSILQSHGFEFQMSSQRNPFSGLKPMIEPLSSGIYFVNGFVMLTEHRPVV
eukprot:TRINITY_DN11915_c0_g1_i1.p1 TRINITY_DN11915_c0_g1~~TRINITY_DN11915_c0_g1_i1.p1  ORF type:complete len:419 (-),score=66.96 TRINITY_DN11915_c0_g1_i1:427-1683(-)